MFGDLRARASVVYRVHTQSSVYIVGFHELRGRKYAIVRGLPGTDREHVIVRDSDPRVGGRSMFEVPVSEWPGHELEVATMTSSTIISAVPETDPGAIAGVGVDGEVERNPWARPGPDALAAASFSPPASFPAPRPPGFSETPRIVPNRAKGTHPAAVALASPAAQIARQVVVGQGAPPPDPELPYPQRHVVYAENVASLLRSIARRDRFFDDIAGDPALRDRLRRALDDSAALLEQIRRRDRK
ncbi:MAG: hypothetical protein H6Q90_2534 [Deltaproteobacteria bacterium]|nr:hypothetical protein [Deltaproteobacteria bacterium]